jgi:hypothetical protein
MIFRFRGSLENQRSKDWAVRHDKALSLQTRQTSALRAFSILGIYQELNIDRATTSEEHPHHDLALAEMLRGEGECSKEEKGSFPIVVKGVVCFRDEG